MGDFDQGNSASASLQPVVSPDHGSDGSGKKARAKTSTQSTVDLTKDNPSSEATNTFAATDSRVPTEGEHPLYTHSYSLEKFYNRVQKSFRLNSFGNGRLNSWAPTTGAALPVRNQVFHQVVTPPFPNNITWDRIASEVYHNSHGKGTWELDELVKRIFKPPTPNPPNFDIHDSDWQYRVLFLGLAHQCPATFFDLLGQEALFSAQQPYRFWDFTDLCNPMLLLNPEEPLPILWMLSSMFFAHPWTGPAESPLVVEEFESRRRRRQQQKAQAKSPPAKKRSAPSPKTNPRAPKATDHRPSPGRPMATDTSSPAPKVAFADSSAPSQDASATANSRLAGATTDGANKGTTIGSTSDNSVNNVPTTNVAPQDPPSTPNRPPPTPNRPPRAPNQTATPTRGSAPPPPPPALQRHGQSLVGGSTFSTVAAAPAPATRPLSSLEKIQNLTQSCVNGLPFKHAYIFRITIGYHWEGASAGTNTSHQTVHQAFRRFADGIFNEIGTDITK